MPVVTLTTFSRGSDIIRRGEPAGAVWHSGDQDPAAADLVEFLRRMSGAEVQVLIAEGREKPPRDEPAIVHGEVQVAVVTEGDGSSQTVRCCGSE